MPRGHYERRERKPTWTSLTEETLRIMDDYLTMHQIVQLTGGSSNQITAALHMLKHYLVVDCVIAEGQLFWFVTGLDTRTKVVEERVPEDKPRKRRSRKSSPPAGYTEVPVMTEPPAGT